MKIGFVINVGETYKDTDLNLSDRHCTEKNDLIVLFVLRQPVKHYRLVDRGKIGCLSERVICIGFVIEIIRIKT